MILSILICSLYKRSESLAILKQSLRWWDNFAHVEILTDIDNGEKTIGRKRNDLVKRATGKYVVFIDDDDEVSFDYTSEIIAAAALDMDCITFNGYMTTNGTNRVDFDIALNNPYTAAQINGKQVYLRWPNHIVPIKREIALQIQFPEKNMFEDYEWSLKLKESGLLKTSIKIEKFLYHYVYRTHK